MALSLMGQTVSAQMVVTNERAAAESQLRKLSIAEMAIKALYVDEVDEQKLVEDAIRGMLEKLDPHSTYTNPKETKAMTEPLNGSFEGIGVQFNMVETPSSSSSLSSMALPRRWVSWPATAS